MPKKKESIIYNVWLEIECYNEISGHSETLVQPGGALAVFENYQKACEFAGRVTELADALAVNL